MRSIDIHAHISPEGYVRALERGEDWYGIAAGANWFHESIPRTLWSPEQRLVTMDSLGVDVHVLSTNAILYLYDQDAATVAAMDRECNDYVSQLTKDHPDRFAGLANLPMQDVAAAATELERSMTQLGLKGAMIDDSVNGKTYDEPEFYPLWEVAEQTGAMILIHQGMQTVVGDRSTRYHLPNTIGNLVERAITYSSFVFGGVMDKYPNLRICLSHGGGYTCFGAGRMDRGWQVRSEARVNINKPPSTYLNRFWYDCLTHSEPALRMLIDSVGIEKVLFGTDWPFDMQIDWPVSWVLGLESLTQEEKEAILYKNVEQLLGI